eukprot:2104-Heterococcus_DN1.PRE.2
MASTLRLIKELNQLAADPPHGISAAPISEDNMMMWNATILGPDESPFEGGIYSLSITFSESEYPSKPPKMRFLCEMYHPNIYSNGTICLDVLQTCADAIIAFCLRCKAVLHQHEGVQEASATSSRTELRDVILIKHYSDRNSLQLVQRSSAARDAEEWASFTHSVVTEHCSTP